jgi:opacity protein-like surface antigen
LVTKKTTEASIKAFVVLKLFLSFRKFLTNKTIKTMKKLFLSALLVSAVLFSANAQMTGGVRLGANLSNMKFSFEGDSESLDSKIGFQIGGYLDFAISDQFSVSPEILFSQFGGKESEGGETFTLNLNYISIPVMAKVKLGDMFNIQAGPQLGLLMGAKVKFDGGDFDVKEDYTSTDFGLGFGAGVDLDNGLNINLRYYLGLGNIAEGGDSDFKIQNSAIQFSVGYRLFGN